MTENIATALRPDLLSRLSALSTNELRGILLAREADVGVLAGGPNDVRIDTRVTFIEVPCAAPGAIVDRVVDELGRITSKMEVPPPLDFKIPPLPATLHLSALNARYAAIYLAVKGGARSRGEIMAATGAHRSQLAKDLEHLRETESVFMAGTKRFARYGLVQLDAELAHQVAVQSAKGPIAAMRRPAAPAPKRRARGKPRAKRS